MKTIRVMLRSVNDGLSLGFQQRKMFRTLSTNITSGTGTDDNQSTRSFESADDFERRIFGGISERGTNSDAFYQKLDGLEKAYDRSRMGSQLDGRNRSKVLDGLDDSFSTLSDGMGVKLKKATTYFEYDPEEVDKDNYSFRPDIKFKRGMTYDTKDLDLTRPGVRKSYDVPAFEVTTEEVLKKADFRNVRFLANFITQSGIIIKRSTTKISAKAQRKVAREIKTARAFGLMPFTTMGKKSFVFGKTMEDLDEDYEYESYDGQITASAEGSQDPL